MPPFEHLRRLARWTGDSSSFLYETALCLAEFDDDRAGLVVACRRLLAHHPANGALWWMCSRVCCALDPAKGAIEAWDVLADDDTAGRLAGALPFPHDHPIVVFGWPSVVAKALQDRPDLDIRGELEEFDASDVSGGSDFPEGRSATHLLVAVEAVGHDVCIAPAGAEPMVSAARELGMELWLVASRGRVLPQPLMAAALRALRSSEVDASAYAVLALDDVAHVAVNAGLIEVPALPRHVECPVAQELLRIA